MYIFTLYAINNGHKLRGLVIYVTQCKIIYPGVIGEAMDFGLLQIIK